MLLWSSQAVAQVKMGARTGLNMSTVTNTEVDIGVKRMAVGPGGGFVAHIPVTDIFAVQTELLFNARGVSASASFPEADQRSTKRIYYLDLPLALRAYGDFGKVRVFAGTGPQFALGLFVQDVVRTSGRHYTNKFSETSAFSPKTRRFEIAWIFDAGIAVPLADRSELEFSIRPVLGVINIAREEFNEDNNRNLMVSFSTAWLFGR